VQEQTVCTCSATLSIHIHHWYRSKCSQHKLRIGFKAGDAFFKSLSSFRATANSHTTSSFRKKGSDRDHYTKNVCGNFVHCSANCSFLALFTLVSVLTLLFGFLYELTRVLQTLAFINGLTTVLQSLTFLYKLTTALQCITFLWTSTDDTSNVFKICLKVLDNGVLLNCHMYYTVSTHFRSWVCSHIIRWKRNMQKLVLLYLLDWSWGYLSIRISFIVLFS
jgi:hypothetical protein